MMTQKHENLTVDVRVTPNKPGNDGSPDHRYIEYTTRLISLVRTNTKHPSSSSNDHNYNMYFHQMFSAAVCQLMFKQSILMMIIIMGGKDEADQRKIKKP